MAKLLPAKDFRTSVPGGMPHCHVAMVPYEPAGSRRWWRRKGAGQCLPPPPLPSLRRAGSRSGGGGGGSGSEGDLPFRCAASFGSPASGFNRRARWSDAGQSEEELRLIPTSGLRLGLGLPPDRVRCPRWRPHWCPGIRSVAGGIRRGARPPSHPDVDQSLGGGSWSTTRSCCYNQRRGYRTSHWKELGGAVDSPGVASSGEIGTHCTQGTGSNRIPEVGTKWVSTPRSLPISIATSGETHFPTRTAKSSTQTICLFTIWVIKLACCCWWECKF